MKILFSLGVDATILVKYWQYCNNLGATVGGIKFNHCLGLSKNTGEDIITIMKDCLVGKHWYVSDEAKLAVISFQKYPPGVCPNFFWQGIIRPSTRAMNLARLLWIFLKRQQSKMLIQQSLMIQLMVFLAKWNGISH